MPHLYTKWGRMVRLANFFIVHSRTMRGETHWGFELSLNRLNNRIGEIPK